MTPSDTQIITSPEIKSVFSEVMQRDYPVEISIKAYSIFMLGGKSLQHVADEVGVPLPVIEEWSRKKQWSVRQAEYAMESIRALNTEASRVQAESRLATIKAHLEKARDIVAKAHETALAAPTASALKNATEAMTSAAAMEARAAGLAEKTVQQRDTAGSDTPQGATPYVFIGLSAMAPPEPAAAPAINVPAKDIKEVPLT